MTVRRETNSGHRY